MVGTHVEKPTPQRLNHARLTSFHFYGLGIYAGYWWHYDVGHQWQPGELVTWLLSTYAVMVFVATAFNLYEEDAREYWSERLA